MTRNTFFQVIGLLVYSIIATAFAIPEVEREIADWGYHHKIESMKEMKRDASNLPAFMGDASQFVDFAMTPENQIPSTPLPKGVKNVQKK